MLADGPAEITNATIVGNRADADAGGQATDIGGGLSIGPDIACVMNNTIVAGNRRGDSDTSNDEIAGTLDDTSASNLIADPATAGSLVDDNLDNQIGLLGAVTPLDRIIQVDLFRTGPRIADNGGPTRSVRLVRNSLAIETGSEILADASDFDQRGEGFPRTQPGFPDLNSNGGVDIGALEFDPILVTTVAADEDDGTIDPAIGTGTSLREAIARANESPGTDLILFSRGTNGTTNFIDSTDPKIIRPSTDFVITTSVSITGPGAEFLILDGDVDQSGNVTDGDTRLFSYSIPSTSATILQSRLSGLTLRNGSPCAAVVMDNGGAIFNNNLSNLVVTDLIIEDSTASDGGGIYNLGQLNIISSTLRRNLAINRGGGLFTERFASTQNSTFSENTAAQGGAVFVSDGSYSLLNSTLSANTAADGGGILYENGTARLANSTIVQNTATNTDAGGGIEISAIASAPSFELDNTIVAGNLSPGANGNDISGGPVLSGSLNNLIGNANSSGGLTDGDDGNIVGVNGTSTINFDLILGPLADNGGETLTHFPVSDSLALDAGDVASATFFTFGGTPLSTDQRRLPRIVGNVDIGSVEVQNQAPVLDPIGDQFIPELELLNFTVTATIPDGGAEPVYSLEDGPFGFVPNGATIDPDSGEFFWEPAEEDGPDFFEFDVVVARSDNPSSTTRETILIEVSEVNEPPFIEPIDDMSAEVGVLLQFTAFAFDPDIPENFLSFTLDDASEARGMQINFDTGEFTFTPTTPGNFLVTITVEDDGGDGGDPLIDSTSFNIEVTAGTIPTVSISTTSPGTLHERDSFSLGLDTSILGLAHFNVTRSNPVGDQIVRLRLENTSTAAYTVDYTTSAISENFASSSPLIFTGSPLTASITIPDGETIGRVALSVINDEAAEASESIALSIIPDAAFDTGNATAIQTIPQNDFGVTSLADFDPSTAPNGGESTLRQATINAKAGLTRANIPGPELPVITFATGLVGDIVLTNGALLLDTADFNINGPGSDLLQVSGDGASRVLIAFDSGADLSYNISGLHITNGFTSGNGGAIFNSENLTLADCIVSNSIAENGGGITNEGTLVLESCLVSMNNANIYGGGIDNFGGNASLRFCTISANLADFGGGIENNTGGNLTVQSNAITNNTAALSGGGIDSFSATTLVANTTISGNNAGFGAGFFNEQSAVTITQSTIAENTASTSTGGLLASSNAPVGNTLVHNTIIAGNTNGDIATDDPSFVELDPGSSNNLISDAASAGGLIDGINANQVGVSGTILAALADNGGPTATHALVPGSPAIDAGNNTFASLPPFDARELPLFPFDQRGAGFIRIFDGTVDIGAFEIQPQLLQALSCELSEGPAATITWRSTEGTSYDVLCSSDLKNWIVIASEVPATGETTSYTDETPPAGQAYFIIRQSQ